MAKNSSLAVKVFTIIVALLLVGLVFIPTFQVKATIDDGSEVVFSTSVSFKDVLSVGLLNGEAKQEALDKARLDRADAMLELEMKGEDAKDIAKIVNSMSCSKKFALLTYFSSGDEYAVIGLAPATWLLILAILLVLMIIALVALCIYSLLAIYLNSKGIVLQNKIIAFVVGGLGLVISLITMICLKGGSGNAVTNVTFAFFGYLFLVVSVFEPLMVMVAFGSNKPKAKKKT